MCAFSLFISFITSSLVMLIVLLSGLPLKIDYTSGIYSRFSFEKKPDRKYSFKQVQISLSSLVI